MSSTVEHRCCTRTRTVRQDPRYPCCHIVTEAGDIEETRPLSIGDVDARVTM